MTERVTQITRNPWKLTAIGMALVATTALVTGIVMASRSKPDETAAAPAPAVKNPARTVAQVTARPRVPEQVVVKACNEYNVTALPDCSIAGTPPATVKSQQPQIAARSGFARITSSVRWWTDATQILTPWRAASFSCFATSACRSRAM